MIGRPKAAYRGAAAPRSDVRDVSRDDAAEFFGELLLELEAHIGRAAERVRRKHSGLGLSYR